MANRVPRRVRILDDYALAIYDELMKQDWVKRHESLQNLLVSDRGMYHLVMANHLSPAEALDGSVTGRESHGLGVLPLGYAPRRRVTLCKLFRVECNCTIRQ